MQYMVELVDVIKDGKNILLIIPPNIYQKIMNSFYSVTDSSIIVSLNKSADLITPNFPKESKSVIIDIGNSQEIPETQKRISVQSPQSLSEISISISQATRVFSNPKLIFDSLSTLLVYNQLDVVLKFVHFIVSKARLLNYGTVFIILKDTESEKIMPKLGAFFDEIVYLKDEVKNNG